MGYAATECGGKKKTMKSDKSTTNSAGEEISPNTGCHRGGDHGKYTDVNKHGGQVNHEADLRF